MFERGNIPDGKSDNQMGKLVPIEIVRNFGKDSRRYDLNRYPYSEITLIRIEIDLFSNELTILLLMMLYRSFDVEEDTGYGLSESVDYLLWAPSNTLSRSGIQLINSTYLTDFTL